MKKLLVLSETDKVEVYYLTLLVSIIDVILRAIRTLYSCLKTGVFEFFIREPHRDRIVNTMISMGRPEHTVG